MAENSECGNFLRKKLKKRLFRTLQKKELGSFRENKPKISYLHQPKAVFLQNAGENRQERPAGR